MEQREVEGIVMNAVVGEVGDDGVDVTLDSRFREDLGLDSLSMAAIAFEIDDAIGTTSDISVFKNVTTLREIVAAILAASQLASSPPASTEIAT